MLAPAGHASELPSPLRGEDSVVPLQRLSFSKGRHEDEEEEFKRLLYVPTGMRMCLCRSTQQPVH